MSILLLLVAALQQPQIEATVEPTEVEVGDEVVVTVRVDADGGVPTEGSVPSYTGLDLLGTSQSSVFTSVEGRGRRETTWEYRFRAVTPGRAVIGPVRVRIGVDFLEAGELSVTVTAAGAGMTEAFDERVAAIVDAAPGPGASDDVTVTVIPSHDTIVVGDQLDLVVVAWFPRDIRSRLRARPTLTPPELQGAWTYPRTAALGVADTREVEGRRYDLFVHHQVAFPLTPGTLQVGGATVSYSLPVRTSIMSREVPQEVRSRETTVTVLPQPRQARPERFAGAAARNLAFSVVVDSGGFDVGNAITVTATVNGEGNVALWPRPEFRWPDGVRVYEGRTDVDITTEAGLVGGTKTFTYLIAPESTGTYIIPPPTYTYFALDSGRYIQAAAPRIELAARAVRSRVSGDVTPPPVMARRGMTSVERFTRQLPVWMLVLVIGVPPLTAGAVPAVTSFHRRRKRIERRGPVDSTLVTLEREFRRKLEALVPGVATREGGGLSAALRAAGVEAPVATHASRVRDRLRQAVYGPGGASDSLELAAEVHEVLRALPGGRRERRGTVRVAGLTLLLSLVTARATAAQATAEQLYEAGAFRAAADSFLARAAEEPADYSQWFNAGNALFGAGEETAALVAWVKAARTAPRDGAVRSAMRLAPVVDTQARRATWVAPVTVQELALAGLMLWVVGWIAMAVSRRARWGLIIVGLGLVLAAAAAYLHGRYTEPVALVLVSDLEAREAPYGTAQSTTRFPEGTAVRVEREAGAWLLVNSGADRGWVLSDEVGRL